MRGWSSARRAAARSCSAGASRRRSISSRASPTASRRRGVPVRIQVLDRKREPAPSEVAGSLGLRPGAPVVHLRRLAWLGDDPAVILDAWLPGRPFERLADYDDFDSGRSPVRDDRGRLRRPARAGPQPDRGRRAPPRRRRACWGCPRVPRSCGSPRSPRTRSAAPRGAGQRDLPRGPFVFTMTSLRGPATRRVCGPVGRRPMIDERRRSRSCGTRSRRSPTSSPTRRPRSGPRCASSPSAIGRTPRRGHPHRLRRLVLRRHRHPARLPAGRRPVPPDSRRSSSPATRSATCRRPPPLVVAVSYGGEVGRTIEAATAAGAGTGRRSPSLAAPDGRLAQSVGDVVRMDVPTLGFSPGTSTYIAMRHGAAHARRRAGSRARPTGARRTALDDALARAPALARATLDAG